MLKLPDVTLLSVTSVGVEDTVEALRFSSRAIEFGAVKPLSPTRPDTLPPGIEHVVVPPMDLTGYSRFVLGQLYRHFDTSHCLIVQADGFVISPGLWRDDFLACDYIGAPWDEFIAVGVANQVRTMRLDRNRVGNGGFSLRSRRFMELAATIDFDRVVAPLRSEDFILCHHVYPGMCARGMKYASLELAATFAMESPDRPLGQRLDNVFGFHGKHLLAEVLAALPDNDFAALRRRLSP